MEPVVAFSGIGKFYSRDVLYIFVTVFIGGDQPQREPVILGQRLSIHLENKKNPVPSQFFQRETFIIGIGGFEINVFCGGVGLNPVKKIIDAKAFPLCFRGPTFHAFQPGNLGMYFKSE